MINTAVIGYGMSAKVFHLPFIAHLPEFNLVGISTRQQAAQQQWPGIPRYDTAEALIEQTDAELVVITAPNAAHFPLARAALMQGKHVLLEKPFVTTVAEGLELMALARRHQRLLAVYHNRRWDGDFLTLQQLIKDNRVGAVKYFESQFSRFRPDIRQRWREAPGAGAGFWFDLGPHLVDQALVLFGMPHAVSGRCLALRPGSSTTDYFHVQLHYEDKEVVLHSTPFCAAPNLRYQLQGMKGSYVKYGVDPQEAALARGESPGGKGWGAESPAHYGTWYRQQGAEPLATECGAYQSFFQQLAKAIRHNGKVPVPVEDALRGIYLLELAISSSAAGRTLRVHDPLT